MFRNALVRALRFHNPMASSTAVVVYTMSVFMANWLIRNWGTMMIPGGTHLVPVGFGLMAPSGVFAAGLTFVARDVLQRSAGRGWSVIVIVPGTLLSALLSPQLAAASATAFLFSELVDFGIFTPLQRRGLVAAVFVSGVAASIADSLIFLFLAGIPLTSALPGLLLGKVWVQIAATPVIAGLRRALPVAATA
jgi:uncharacterized PurR-regulated membrane protein YhhQ (DUF165 family)